MDMIKIFKALSNPIRLKILGWLKTPEQHFPPHRKVEGFEQGVCVAFIQKKAQLSQSTTSQYMIILHQAGLVIPTRIGKWTYYKRNEQMMPHASVRCKVYSPVTARFIRKVQV